jgi:hypothetical protein
MGGDDDDGQIGPFFLFPQNAQGADVASLDHLGFAQK